MFGLSFSELLVIAIVALVAVGPAKLPGMLRTLGEWIRKARNLTYEVRAQSGIDEILRAEGLHGGINELKSLVRSARQPFMEPLYTPPVPRPPSPDPGSGTPESDIPPGADPVPAPQRYEDPYANLDIDATREYPPEGPDAYGALPDDLIDQDDGGDQPRVDVLTVAQPLPEPESPAPDAIAPAEAANGLPSAAPDARAEAPDAAPLLPPSAEPAAPGHRDLNLPPASS